MYIPNDGAVVFETRPQISPKGERLRFGAVRAGFALSGMGARENLDPSGMTNRRNTKSPGLLS